MEAKPARRAVNADNMPVLEALDFVTLLFATDRQLSMRPTGKLRLEGLHDGRRLLSGRANGTGIPAASTEAGRRLAWIATVRAPDRLASEAYRRASKVRLASAASGKPGERRANSSRCRASARLPCFARMAPR